MKVTKISVHAENASEWRVEVRGQPATSHRVTMPPGYAESLGVQAAPEQLVTESFRFLLEREPNTSILREFSLPVIEQYFPEYRDEIARRLA